MNRISLATLALCALGLTACHGAKPVAVHPVAAPPPPVAVAAVTTPPETPKPSPLSLLRAEAEQCAYGDMLGFEPDCEGFKAWSDNTELFEDGSANAMLAEMLENKRAKVRYLAAVKFVNDVEPKTVDSRTANAIIDAGMEEKTDRVARALGIAAGKAPLVKLGVLDHAITAARSPGATRFASAFLGSVGRTNADPKLLALAKELTTSAEDDVVSGDIQLLAALTTANPDEACAALDGLRSHSSRWIASSATSELVTVHRCAKLYGGVLTALTKESTAKTMSFSIGMTLDELCADPALAPADRAKATPLAKKLAASKTTSDSTRVFALRAAVSCDAKGGKAFAGKFKKDKSELVAKVATKLASADR